MVQDIVDKKNVFLRIDKNDRKEIDGRSFCTGIVEVEGAMYEVYLNPKPDAYVMIQDVE